MRLMFFKVLKQHGYLEQLNQKAIVQADQKYKYEYGYLFHYTKIELVSQKNTLYSKFNLLFKLYYSGNDNSGTLFPDAIARVLLLCSIESQKPYLYGTITNKSV